MSLDRTRTWHFKARGADELRLFDIPFSTKEYVQNLVGQVLKALRVREWRAWQRTDLSDDTEHAVSRRKQAKERLIRDYPCLFAGAQGKALKACRNCQPRYLHEARIPLAEVTNPRYLARHDFRAVVVFWKFGADGPTAITWYNNYLDPETEPSHFVDDGTSTSKFTEAVGHKGKGFSLATSFFAELCHDCAQLLQARQDRENEETQAHNATAAEDDLRKHVDLFGKELGLNRRHVSVGFNVGSRLFTTAYPKNSAVLKVKMADLRPLTLDEFEDENPHGREKHMDYDDEDGYASPTESARDASKDSAVIKQERVDPSSATKKAKERLHKVYDKRQQLGLSRDVFTHDYGAYETAVVQEDDVVIHVVGLPGDLAPKDAFSAVYGMFEEGPSWRVNEFEFFTARDGFFLRDQLVSAVSPLKGLGINYHSHLDLTSDRMEIRKGPNKRYHAYLSKLGRALDDAICTIPELAVVVLKVVLQAPNGKYSWRPKSQDAASQYREAFEAAWKLCSPDMFLGQEDKKIYPHHQSRTEDGKLIEEIDWLPCPLEDWKMKILEEAGAYEPIQEHSQKLLRDAPEVPAGELVGADLLTRCIHKLVPDLRPACVSIRSYNYSRPRSLRDGDHFLLPLWTCKNCEPTTAGCLCWVGAALVQLMQGHVADRDLHEIFQVYDKERGLQNVRKLPAREEPPTQKDTNRVPFPEDEDATMNDFINGVDDEDDFARGTEHSSHNDSGSKHASDPPSSSTSEDEYHMQSTRQVKRTIDAIQDRLDSIHEDLRSLDHTGTKELCEDVAEWGQIHKHSVTVAARLATCAARLVQQLRGVAPPVLNPEFRHLQQPLHKSAPMADLSDASDTEDEELLQLQQSSPDLHVATELIDTIHHRLDKMRASVLWLGDYQSTRGYDAAKDAVKTWKRVHDHDITVATRTAARITNLIVRLTQLKRPKVKKLVGNDIDLGELTTRDLERYGALFSDASDEKTELEDDDEDDDDLQVLLQQESEHSSGDNGYSSAGEDGETATAEQNGQAQKRKRFVAKKTSAPRKIRRSSLRATKRVA